METGLPSKPCIVCRLREIECDLKPEGCSQCTGNGRDCPGYGGPGSIWYRDQAKVHPLKRRRLALSPRFRMRSAGRSKHAMTPMFKIQNENGFGLEDCSVFSDRPRLSNALVPSLTERAVPFFLSNYISDAGTSVGYHDFLRDVYSSSPKDGVLGTVLVTLGIAGLAHKTGSQELTAVAQQKHGAALRMINEALRDPVAVREHQTLAAIMVVPLYEIITGESQQSMTAWYTHMAGSMALLAARGPEQFHTKTGRMLFRHLRSQIVYACLYRRQPVPRALRAWKLKSRKYERDPEDLGWASERLLDIAEKLCSISASSVLEVKPSPEEIVKACSAINMEMTKWAIELPPTMTYTTVRGVRSKNVCGSHYHVYQSLISASFWSLFRTMKVQTSELLIEHLKPKNGKPIESLDPTSLSLYRQSVSTINNMVSEIFASVPFHMNHHRPDSPEPRAIGGLFIFWNLYIASTKDSATPAMRQWAIERLEHMGRSLGIQQGNAFAEFIRQGYPDVTLADSDAGYTDVYEVDDDDDDDDDDDATTMSLDGFETDRSSVMMKMSRSSRSDTSELTWSRSPSYRPA